MVTTLLLPQESAARGPRPDSLPREPEGSLTRLHAASRKPPLSLGRWRQGLFAAADLVHRGCCSVLMGRVTRAMLQGDLTVGIMGCGGGDHGRGCWPCSVILLIMEGTAGTRAGAVVLRAVASWLSWMQGGSHCGLDLVAGPIAR